MFSGLRPDHLRSGRSHTASFTGDIPTDCSEILCSRGTNVFNSRRCAGRQIDYRLYRSNTVCLAFYLTEANARGSSSAATTRSAMSSGEKNSTNTPLPP